MMSTMRSAKELKLIKGGANKLQLILDFDQTLTYGSTSSYGLIEKSKIFSEQYYTNAAVLYQKYHKLEWDLSISLEERTEHMVNWWEQAHALILKERPTRQHMVDMIRTARSEGKVQFRAGVIPWLNRLNEYQIPVLIFSAGLGNVIEEIIIQEGLQDHNIQIISNFLDFPQDRNEPALSFKGEIIHCYCKHGSHVPREQWTEKVMDRKHAILAGDSLGDADMGIGMDHDVLFKLGFCHSELPQDFKKYQEKFDRVLGNVPDVGYLQRLTEEIIAGVVRTEAQPEGGAEQIEAKVTKS